MLVEFIDWAGGDMPVDKDTKVCAIFRDGYMVITDATFLHWDKSGHDDDVIAYKVLEDV